MCAFWQPEIVRDFKSACPEFADPPSNLQDYLAKTNETVNEFLARVPKEVPYHTKIAHLQSYLLGRLKDASLVGTYSGFWESSLYENGYSHLETVRLAYL